jgi:hypothetical protein
VWIRAKSPNRQIEIPSNEGTGNILSFLTTSKVQNTAVYENYLKGKKERPVLN